MLENVGDLTFEEAYKKTGRILNISVTNYGKHHDHNLTLNYVSAPNVLIWSAVAASCGLPVILGAIELYCKDSNGKVFKYCETSSRKFIDGSVGGDIPFKEVATVFNVKYSIVS
jgi:TAG lipase/steryl ester hydrolase/phospholipase A2/LPA acyltransferase